MWISTQSVVGPKTEINSLGTRFKGNITPHPGKAGEEAIGSDLISRHDSALLLLHLEILCVDGLGVQPAGDVGQEAGGSVSLVEGEVDLNEFEDVQS